MRIYYKESMKKKDLRLMLFMNTDIKHSMSETMFSNV